MPAFDTSTSMPPNSLTARSIPLLTASSLVTSIAIASALPPAPTMLLATFCALSRFRSAMTTAAPKPASLRAHCSPIPLAAPVITATLLFSDIFVSLSTGLLIDGELNAVGQRQIVESDFAHVQREIGDHLARADNLLHWQIGDRRQGVRMQFERCRTTPCAKDGDVSQIKTHECTEARRAGD